ncbi:hypothetical protein BIW11_06272 [Tropilaelaps mercedesae]|uniref:Uncharacterized protein n=1 Tax=Tropilaelaps mercedesae TaxID=418985 RepID=A0A1V9XYR4_9ACAR|nr:hypothetical protein BIW11_06272 [Tropilaelaps mercedesae]
MGGFLAWATSSISMKRRKPVQVQRSLEELETTTRQLGRDYQHVSQGRKCQEHVARMYKQQLMTLRRHMANESNAESAEILKKQEVHLQQLYEDAKQELKALDMKKTCAKRLYQASQLKLNDVTIDLEDEKRKKRGSLGSNTTGSIRLKSEDIPPVSNEWMTHTL